MDPPESSVNRIGRTIWTVWGYLSGAVARYLRPEVTDEGNQGVRTRTEDTDLKSAVNKINREVTEDNSNNEGKKTNQIDSADVKCSPSNVRVQVASVQWENTDVAKDDNNDELHVHATKKQTYHCVVWSTGTDTDNERRMVDAQVDKETDSSDEVQAEKAYANNECKESATAHELEETGKIEQKYGDHEDEEERDQNHEVEKCAKNRKDECKTDVMVQLKQNVERKKQINTADHGETEHADEQLIEEKENNLDKEDQENDEEHGLESQVQDLQKSEDPDNTDIVVQCEQDVEQEKQINTVDHEDTEGIAGFKHADEHLFDETEEQIVDQKDQEKTENDEEQGTESQVQDMLPQLEYLTKYSDELAYNSKNDVEEMMSETRSETEQDKENETVQNLEEIGQLEQNDGDSEDEEECDQNPEDEECAMESEDLDNADVMIQSELHGEDVEQEMQISMMDYEEKEGIGGFKHSDDDHIDEKEKQTVDQMDQEKTENDEEQGTESQVQDVLPQQDYFPDEADGLATPERLKVMEKYSDEIDEFSKEGVEEVLLETEHDEDTTESEQDTIKYEVMESVETLQTVSEELSAKKVPNVELKMTTLVDEFLETVNNPKLSDSKLDTSENTPEMGTGSSVVATKPEGMISDRIVCEFPGELRKGPETDLGCFEEVQTTLHDLQTLTEEQAEREAVVVCSVEHLETLRTVETKKDIETLIESLGSTESHAHQETDKTTFSHKEHVELRTELTEETIDKKISSEVEEAEPTMKEDQSSVIRNVSLQSHELLEFKGECKSSVGTMDTFSESSVSEIAGTAEIKHLAEEQTDVKPVLTRSLSPAEFLEETVHLKGVSERCTEEAAFEYVEGITNQVLKDMLERQVNVVQETEPLARPSTEEHGDAENKGPAQCVSADAFVLEEEGKSLGETIETKEEMEVETTSNEVLKQTECETTETDGRRDQTQKVIAGETVLRSHEDVMEVSRPGMKRGFDQVSKDLAEVKAKGKFDLYLQAFEESSLDFTIQKARIAVKNPLVRPPKDPRSLLFKVSVEPLVSQPSPRGQKIEVSVPSKGVTGFKLPGLGAGLPVLRKTEFGKKAREGGAAERTLQTQQEPVAVTEDSVKQEQVPAKPKWTPPRHPGMGSPFMMAELKNKLKKPVQE